jgi:predicted transcriptional regulator
MSTNSALQKAEARVTILNDLNTIGEQVTEVKTRWEHVFNTLLPAAVARGREAGLTEDEIAEVLNLTRTTVRRLQGKTPKK